MSEISRRKLRYSILRELDKGNEINHETFDLTPSEFTEKMRELIDDEYITGVLTTKDGVVFNNARPTILGEKYVEVNSTLAKSYSVLKEIRDWIKL